MIQNDSTLHGFGISLLFSNIFLINFKLFELEISQFRLIDLID